MDNINVEKTLSCVWKIFDIIYNTQCTYDEAEDILKMVADGIRISRRDLEYETFTDYLKRHKTRDVSNEIITRFLDED